jgi:hypothetical protein
MPQAAWVGIDSADKFFSLARKYLPGTVRYNLVKGDVYKLREKFPVGSFDVAFSIQTLTWLPRYEDVMREIMGVTGKWIFVTSLFSDFNVDVFSEVYEYKEDWTAANDSPYNYNVYSFPKFRDFCMNCGAREVIGEDFIIDMDLVAPANKLMGTYTVDSLSGTRIQFSGPVFMPWKMIAVRLG